MFDRIVPRAALAAHLLWAAGPSPARADSVDQQRLQQALNLGQSKGTGSIAVYVDGRLAAPGSRQSATT